MNIIGPRPFASWNDFTMSAVIETKVGIGDSLPQPG